MNSLNLFNYGLSLQDQLGFLFGSALSNSAKVAVFMTSTMAASLQMSTLDTVP